MNKSSLAFKKKALSAAYQLGFDCPSPNIYALSDTQIKEWFDYFYKGSTEQAQTNITRISELYPGSKF